ncbi:MAG: hypothetical protein HY066_04070 [Betaproteobacteria bacterium]|nr:hypothetical protein [Betaproteobacteria bacterium]
MNISSAVGLSYTAKTATVAGTLYSSVASGMSTTIPVAQTSVSPDTVVSFSSQALDLMRLRQVSDKTVQQFKDILAKANATNAANAQADPKAFLYSLSSSEMEVLRQVHSLANSIDISTLTNEGAGNLLIQPGSAKDMDNNGLTTIGAANTIVFPPQNAPESFKTAWASATAGMSGRDIPVLGAMVLAVGLANLHYDTSTGKVKALEPSDPGWRNPYADPSYDYKGAVSNILGGLKYELEHNMISYQQYQQNMSFYTRLSNAMG